MADMFLGSQTPIYQNVAITKRNLNGKIIETRTAKNRVTKLMLFGIARFLLGQFNDSTPDKIYEYIPRYLAVGSNTPNPNMSDASVTAIPSVNDTMLMNEYITSSRKYISERNVNSINSKFSDPTIKISIKTYLDSNSYNDMSIGEMGLFSKEKNNNCLARVCFEPITKKENEVIDIQWDITLMSYGETKYPDNISLSSGNDILLYLRNSNIKYKEIDLGLIYEPNENYTCGKFLTTDGNVLFNINEDRTIELENSVSTDFIFKLDWCSHLQKIGLISLTNTKNDLDNLIKLLTNSKIDNLENPYYLYVPSDDDVLIATPFHFNHLYNEISTSYVNSNSLLCTLEYVETTNYKDSKTKYKYVGDESTNSFEILDNKGNPTDYKTVNGQVYQLLKTNTDNWNPIDAYFYNGVIINRERKELGYRYYDGVIYSTVKSSNDVFTRNYLNFPIYAQSSNNYTFLNKKLLVYHLNENYVVSHKYLAFDKKDSMKRYIIDNSADAAFTKGVLDQYHIDQHNYVVNGETLRITPTITPKNATDKTVNWTIQNSDIAKVSADGVLTAWSAGRTTLVAHTTNNLQTNATVTVLEDDSYIDGIKLELTPKKLEFNINDDNAYGIINSIISPAYATNKTIKWSLDENLTNSITYIELGNGSIKVSPKNKLCNGYITATTNDGLSDQVLVIVNDNESTNDCDNIIHTYSTLVSSM